MKGLVVKNDGRVRLVNDIPMPAVTEYTCLARTVACGICNGTDLKLVEGHLSGYDTYPAVLGHESVGEIVETGKKVRSFKPGDRVLRSSLENSNRYFSLWGGFAEYTRVVDYQAMIADGLHCDEGLCTMQAIPSSIDPQKAVMIITLKEVYSAMRRLGVRPGMRVAVAGCGPVGLAMVNCLKRMGAGAVAMLGHHDDRLAKAQKLGADLAVNTRSEDAEEALKRAGMERLDMYIDAVGRNALVNQALRLVRPDDGVIGVYGIGLDGRTPLALDKAPYNFSIRSVQWPVPALEREAHESVIGTVLDGGFDLDDYVTHVLPVEAFEEGFGYVRDRKALKVSLYF